MKDRDCHQHFNSKQALTLTFFYIEYTTYDIYLVDSQNQKGGSKETTVQASYLQSFRSPQSGLI